MSTPTTTRTRWSPPPHSSVASWLKSLPPEEQEAELNSIAPTETAQGALLYEWSFWARPDQKLPAGTWNTWLLLAGRGFGKTRTGAETVRDWVENQGARRLALVARTAADTRDVMVEGESGLLAISPPWNRPLYEPSKRRLTWPNGAQATLFSAEKPDMLRGPQYDRAWCDELAAWKYAETWDQLQFGLRLGTNPQVVVTTTPRPTPLVKELVADPTTHITRGSTYDNADNLAPRFVEKLLKKYDGTRLGRQEIGGEILTDVPGALWKRDWIEKSRKRFGQVLPPMRRIVVAVDPATSTNPRSNETGIVVCGLGDDSLGYLLDDLSGVYTPAEWGLKVLGAFDTWQADFIVAEVNNGGNLVEANVTAMARTLKRSMPPYKAVHASRGKQTRADPITGLYQQGRVCHAGAFPILEDQLCTWDPLEEPDSPDRLDAAVWGFTELMLGAAPDDALLVRARSSRR